MRASWLKTRARWRETPTELRHSGSVGRRELSEITDEELIAIIHSAGPIPEVHFPAANRCEGTLPES